MDNENVLQDIGFSRAEAKVYLELLKVGETKAGQLIRKTGLQSSVIHNCLNTMIDKGFITYILKGKIKHYSALEPEVVGEYLDTKRASFNDILPELKVIQKSSGGALASAEVFEGFKGLRNATLRLLEGGKRGDVYKWFAIRDSLYTEESIDFFKRVDKLKKDRGIVVRGISEYSARGILEGYRASDIRYTSQRIPPAMNIFKDRVILMSFEDKPMAVMIHSRDIADQYHNLWDSLWSKAKNIKSKQGGL